MTPASCPGSVPIDHGEVEPVPLGPRWGPRPQERPVQARARLVPTGVGTGAAGGPLMARRENLRILEVQPGRHTRREDMERPR